MASGNITPGSPWNDRWLGVSSEELPAVGWAFLYFFCLMAGYYILQPLRDELGISLGLENLPWLFMGTMGTMLLANPIFSMIAARFPRAVFLPLVYRFFLLNLFIFWGFLKWGPADIQVTVSQLFFVWVSVFNLFAVSVFWSFMADVFSSAQGKRFFGLIGAGGTLGQLAGSLMTAFLSSVVGKIDLLIFSMVLLEMVTFSVKRLSGRAGKTTGTDRLEETREKKKEASSGEMSGGAFSGVVQVLKSPYLIGICLFMFLYTFTSSFLYFAKTAIVKFSLSDSNARTAFFGSVNAIVAGTTLILQLGVTGPLIKRVGIALTLGLVPGITVAGFAALYNWPWLYVFAAVEVIRKAGNYAFARPAREVLFTVVSREEKYQAKNLIDTFIYRGGDAFAALVFGWFETRGYGMNQMLLLGIPMALLWLKVSLLLGRAHQAKEENST